MSLTYASYAWSGGQPGTRKVCVYELLASGSTVDQQSTINADFKKSQYAQYVHLKIKIVGQLVGVAPTLTMTVNNDTAPTYATSVDGSNPIKTNTVGAAWNIGALPTNTANTIPGLVRAEIYYNVGSPFGRVGFCDNRYVTVGAGKTQYQSATLGRPETTPISSVQINAVGGTFAPGTMYWVYGFM